tara:strand:- start:362 stop:817 length:456 start_codon:yes stop_codon:yes gene_type:complete
MLGGPSREVKTETKESFHMAKTICFTRRLIMTILIEQAMAADTITYSALAATYNRRINNEDRPRLPESGSALGKVLGGHLDAINHVFHKQNAPYLSALVVRSSGADAGIPGAGFWNSIENIEPYFTSPADFDEKRRIHDQMKEQIYAYWSE